MIAGHLQIKHGIYYMVLSYVDADGNRKQPWISTKLKAKGNKKRAQEMLDDMRRNFVIPASASAVTDISLDMLFGDFLKYWLEIKRESIAATTYASYVTAIEKVIAPHFDKRGLKIEDIRPSDLQAFYNGEAKRVKACTVNHYHIIIHAAYKYLMRLDLIQNNPADRVLLPKRNKYIAEYYNEEELNRLFEVSKKHPLNLLIKVTACYGLRRSEVIGLKWDAIDFEANTMTIKHVVTSVKLDGKTELHMDDRAKTQSSLRTLPLLGDIKELLLEHKKKQKRNMAICGKKYNHEFDEYIFVDSMGNLFKPDYVTGSFRNLIRSNNLKPIRFHDLRHSCATLLLAHDVPMKLIQEWLGHSDIGTTANIYSHTDYKTKMVSADIMKDTLKFKKT